MAARSAKRATLTENDMDLQTIQSAHFTRYNRSLAYSAIVGTALGKRNLGRAERRFGTGGGATERAAAASVDEVEPERVSAGMVR